MAKYPKVPIISIQLIPHLTYFVRTCGFPNHSMSDYCEEYHKKGDPKKSFPFEITKNHGKFLDSVCVRKQIEKELDIQSVTLDRQLDYTCNQKWPFHFDKLGMEFHR